MLPNLAQFDVKAQVVHGQPVPLGYLALAIGYARCLHRHAADRRRCSSSRGAISSKWPRETSLAALGVIAPRRRAARRRGSGAGRARAARIRPPVGADDDRCTSRRGRPLRRLAGALHRAGRRPLLDPRDSVLRRHQAPAGRAAVRAASRRRCWPLERPTSTSCCIRCSTSRPRSIPRFNIAYRFGAVFLASRIRRAPAAPDLAIALLEKGLRERPDKWEYMQDIGFVHYWYATITGRRPSGSRRPARCRARPGGCRSLAATTLAQGGDRQSSRLMWEAIRQSAEIDWLRRDAERRLAAAARARRDRCAAATRGRVHAARGQPAGATGRRSCAQALARRPARSEPDALRADADGRVRLSRSSPLFPLPDRAAAAARARHVMIDDATGAFTLVSRPRSAPSSAAF